MSNDIKTQGTQLWMVNTATTSVEIGNITSFSPPSPQADEIDVTNLASAAKEFIQGLVDYGEGTFAINLTSSAAHQALISGAQAGTTRQFLIGLSDGTDNAPTVSGSAFGTLATTRTFIKFSGFIKAVPIQGDTNSVLKATVTVRNSGQPTFSWKA